MGKNQEPLKVTCPCCQAKLSVDAALGVVLSHEEPPRKGPDDQRGGNIERAAAPA